VPETDYIVATRGQDYVMVYIPTGWGATLDLNLCGWPAARGWWFNCRTGETKETGRAKTNQVKIFNPETSGRGNNWVLVLDNADADFKDIKD